MAEILLGRHAQSHVNMLDLAFGNEESPLTDKGVEQTIFMRQEFYSKYGIIPEDYDKSVAASQYVRAQETARRACFRNIETLELINEGAIPDELRMGRLVLEKHAAEGWIPDEARDRAERFIELVRKGNLDYQVYFTHGLFIAAVLTILEAETPAGETFPHTFDEKRGFIPLQASITSVLL